MSKGGGQQMPTGTQETKTTKELPYWVQPQAQQLVRRATNQSFVPFTPYPYITKQAKENEPLSFYNTLTGEYKPLDTNLGYTSTIAPLSPETEYGLQGITSKALQGNPVNQYATQLGADTLAGNYLNPDTNPYLSSTYDEAARKMSDAYLKGTVPQLNAASQRAGAFGGSADALLKAEAMKGFGQNLGDLATNIYGGNYANERANQMKALALAPTTAGQNYADLNTLLGVGDVRNQYNQQVLSDLANQWGQQNQYPNIQLSQLANLLGQATQGTGTTTTTGETSAYGASPLARLFGGATSGAGLGLMASSILGKAGTPYSTPISAALGFLPLLGSMF